jgi:hypothetical protein
MLGDSQGEILLLFVFYSFFKGVIVNSATPVSERTRWKKKNKCKHKIRHKICLANGVEKVVNSKSG